jgi:hypothetical protein
MSEEVMATRPADETSVRPYHEADTAALVELFARVFGARITAEHWRWKLGHDGAMDNVWLAVARDEPVFQYAGIPQRYRLDDRTRDCLVSVDTMTHPDFRRRGLLTRVAAEAYAAWRNAGAAFVFGLPNQQWGSRTTALGWTELFHLQWFARPLRPEAYLARRFKLPWLRHLRGGRPLFDLAYGRLRAEPGEVVVEEITTAGPDFDALWQRLAAELPFSAIRDRAWVQWRFLSSPLRRYHLLAAHRGTELVGYLAYSLPSADGRVSAQLAELIVPRDEHRAAAALLGEFAARADARGAETLVTLAVPGQPQAEWLRRRGFFTGAGFSVQIVPLAADLPLDRLRDARQWRLTGADFDVI